MPTNPFDQYAPKPSKPADSGTAIGLGAGLGGFMGGVTSKVRVKSKAPKKVAPRPDLDAKNSAAAANLFLGGLESSNAAAKAAYAPKPKPPANPFLALSNEAYKPKPKPVKKIDPTLAAYNENLDRQRRLEVLATTGRLDSVIPNLDEAMYEYDVAMFGEPTYGYSTNLTPDEKRKRDHFRAVAASKIKDSRSLTPEQMRAKDLGLEDIGLGGGLKSAEIRQDLENAGLSLSKYSYDKASPVWRKDDTLRNLMGKGAEVIADQNKLNWDATSAGDSDLQTYLKSFGAVSARPAQTLLQLGGDDSTNEEKGGVGRAAMLVLNLMPQMLVGGAAAGTGSLMQRAARAGGSALLTGAATGGSDLVYQASKAGLGPTLASMGQGFIKGIDPTSDAQFDERVGAILMGVGALLGGYHVGSSAKSFLKNRAIGKMTGINPAGDIAAQVEAIRANPNSSAARLALSVDEGFTAEEVAAFNAFRDNLASVFEQVRPGHADNQLDADITARVTMSRYKAAQGAKQGKGRTAATTPTAPDLQSAFDPQTWSAVTSSGEWEQYKNMAAQSAREIEAKAAQGAPEAAQAQPPEPAGATPEQMTELAKLQERYAATIASINSAMPANEHGRAYVNRQLELAQESFEAEKARILAHGAQATPAATQGQPEMQPALLSARGRTVKDGDPESAPLTFAEMLDDKPEAAPADATRPPDSNAGIIDEFDRLADETDTPEPGASAPKPRVDPTSMPSANSQGAKPSQPAPRPEIYDSSLDSLTFDDLTKAGVEGLYVPGTNRIALTREANLNTAIHEDAHRWLDLMPQKFQDSWIKLVTGEDGASATPEDIRRAHETWAYMTERVMMRGTVPDGTPALVRQALDYMKKTLLDRESIGVNDGMRTNKGYRALSIRQYPEQAGIPVVAPAAPEAPAVKPDAPEAAPVKPEAPEIAPAPPTVSEPAPPATEPAAPATVSEPAPAPTARRGRTARQRFDEEKPATDPVTSFVTEKGSTYEVSADGKTTRNKAPRDTPGHEGDFGPKPQSERTIYVDPKIVSALSSAGLNGNPRARVMLKDGKVSLLVWNDKQGRYGISPSGKDISFVDKPKVGLAPLELWDAAGAADVPYEAYANMHAGSPIVSVGDSPNPAPVTARNRTQAKPAKPAKSSEAPQAPVAEAAPPAAQTAAEKFSGSRKRQTKPKAEAPAAPAPALSFPEIEQETPPTETAKQVGRRRKKTPDTKGVITAPLEELDMSALGDKWNPPPVESPTLEQQAKLSDKKASNANALDWVMRKNAPAPPLPSEPIGTPNPAAAAKAKERYEAIQAELAAKRAEGERTAADIDRNLERTYPTPLQDTGNPVYGKLRTIVLNHVAALKKAGALSEATSHIEAKLAKLGEKSDHVEAAQLLLKTGGDKTGAYTAYLDELKQTHGKNVSQAVDAAVKQHAAADGLHNKRLISALGLDPAIYTEGDMATNQVNAGRVKKLIDDIASPDPRNNEKAIRYIEEHQEDFSLETVGEAADLAEAASRRGQPISFKRRLFINPDEDAVNSVLNRIDPEERLGKSTRQSIQRAYNRGDLVINENNELVRAQTIKTLADAVDSGDPMPEPVPAQTKKGARGRTKKASEQAETMKGGVDSRKVKADWRDKAVESFLKLQEEASQSGRGLNARITKDGKPIKATGQTGRRSIFDDDDAFYDMPEADRKALEAEADAAVREWDAADQAASGAATDDEFVESALSTLGVPTGKGARGRTVQQQPLFSIGPGSDDDIPKVFNHLVPKSAVVVKQKMPPKMPLSQFINFLKGNGVKAEEIKYLGLDNPGAYAPGGAVTARAKYGDPVVTKDDALNLIREKANSMFEGRMLQDPEPGQPRRHAAPTFRDDKYPGLQLPGGSGYAERLVGHGMGGGRPDHFSDAMHNNMMWSRTTERVVDGKRTLFAEELQSDRHQQGRRVGYASTVDEFATAAQPIEKLESELAELLKKEEELVKRADEEYPRQFGDDRDPEQLVAEQLARNEIYDVQSEIHTKREEIKEARGKLPAFDAPFKDNWQELGVRKLIADALNEGYDQVAWTTGRTQAKRYKKLVAEGVDGLTIEGDGSGKYSLRIEKDGYGDFVEMFNLSADELADTIGRNMAKQAATHINSTGKPFDVGGDKFDVGAEFYEIVYDKKMVNEAKAIAKKFGGEVTQSTVAGETVHAMELTPAVKAAIRRDGLSLFSLKPGEKSPDGYFARARAAMKKLQESKRLDGLRPIHDAVVYSGAPEVAEVMGRAAWDSESLFGRVRGRLLKHLADGIPNVDKKEAVRIFNSGMQKAAAGRWDMLSDAEKAAVSAYQKTRSPLRKMGEALGMLIERPVDRFMLRDKGDFVGKPGAAENPDWVSGNAAYRRDHSRWIKGEIVDIEFDETKGYKFDKSAPGIDAADLSGQIKITLKREDGSLYEYVPEPKPGQFAAFKTASRIKDDMHVPRIYNREMIEKLQAAAVDSPFFQKVAKYMIDNRLEADMESAVRAVERIRAFTRDRIKDPQTRLEQMRVADVLPPDFYSDNYLEDALHDMKRTAADIVWTQYAGEDNQLVRAAAMRPEVDSERLLAATNDFMQSIGLFGKTESQQAWAQLAAIDGIVQTGFKMGFNPTSPIKQGSTLSVTLAFFGEQNTARAIGDVVKSRGANKDWRDHSSPLHTVTESGTLDAIGLASEEADRAHLLGITSSSGTKAMKLAKKSQNFVDKATWLFQQADLTQRLIASKAAEYHLEGLVEKLKKSPADTKVSGELKRLYRFTDDDVARLATGKIGRNDIARAHQLAGDLQVRARDGRTIRILQTSPGWRIATRFKLFDYGMWQVLKKAAVEAKSGNIAPAIKMLGYGAALGYGLDSLSGFVKDALIANGYERIVSAITGKPVKSGLSNSNIVKRGMRDVKERADNGDWAGAAGTLLEILAEGMMSGGTLGTPGSIVRNTIEAKRYGSNLPALVQGVKDYIEPPSWSDGTRIFEGVSRATSLYNSTNKPLKEAMIQTGKDADQIDISKLTKKPVSAVEAFARGAARAAGDIIPAAGMVTKNFEPTMTGSYKANLSEEAARAMRNYDVAYRPQQFAGQSDIGESIRRNMESGKALSDTVDKIIKNKMLYMTNGVKVPLYGMARDILNDQRVMRAVARSIPAVREMIGSRAWDKLTGEERRIIEKKVVEYYAYRVKSELETKINEIKTQNNSEG